MSKVCLARRLLARVEERSRPCSLQGLWNTTRIGRVFLADWNDQRGTASEVFLETALTLFVFGNGILFDF